jgi:hypothetical protein
MLATLWYFATMVAALVWLVGSPLGAKLTAAELVRGLGGAVAARA